MSSEAELGVARPGHGPPRKIRNYLGTPMFKILGYMIHIFVAAFLDHISVKSLAVKLLVYIQMLWVRVLLLVVVF
jgi:hypothetical protein